MTTPSVDTIEQLHNDTIMIVCNDEDSAKAYIRRNPRCQVIRDENNGDARLALIYKEADINMLNVVKRA
jgi:hypothetical protein